ncbi:KAP family NTPase [Providencia rettgeri]|uniref:KAP family P-loop NTPase fold protein n=1 Tax=Providencia rettgeri TaxID=587 RepID=UPI00226FD744|nr:P-loop NTPase fold protein [Providencia rettgeri]MCX9095889.1 KAP family NTPase [Providencia rettgeri]
MQSELSFSTRDEFSRKPIAEKLINLLESDIDLSPIVINGDWGTGKTEFCLKTIQEMKGSNEKLKCVYIDTFNADSSDEPILTLIAAIVSLFPDKEDKKSIINKAIPVIKYASKVLLNASTTLILKENAEKLGEDLSEALKDQTATAIDATIDNLLDTHEKSTENINALRSILESFALDSPVIVFIDELDRCRPNYALKMIESIKHIFNIKNVKFVLVTNVNQLSSSINKLYGESINANRYLDKFIGFKIELIEYHRKYDDKIYSNSVEYFDFLISKNKELNFLSTFPGHKDFISFLIKVHRLSLRDIERLYKFLLVYQITSGCEIGRHSYFLNVVYKVFGVFIYMLNEDLRDRFITGDYTCEDVFSVIGVQDYLLEEIISSRINKTAVEIITPLLVEANNYSNFKYRNNSLIEALEDKWNSSREHLVRGNIFFEDANAKKFVQEVMYSLMLL